MTVRAGAPRPPVPLPGQGKSPCHHYREMGQVSGRAWLGVASPMANKKPSTSPFPSWVFPLPVWPCNLEDHGDLRILGELLLFLKGVKAAYGFGNLRGGKELVLRQALRPRPAAEQSPQPLPKQ